MGVSNPAEISLGLTIWRTVMDALRTKQRQTGGYREVAGPIRNRMSYCRTPDPRRLPAAPNRGRKWPPCRLTADRRRWFGEFSHGGTAEANGRTAARAVAEACIRGDRPRAAGSALCVSLRDSYRQ